MHQDCNGQKGESTAMNRTVKDNKQTSDQLFVIISFLFSVTALNIFYFIPQGLYCSFLLQFLEMKTFYIRNRFLVQPGSPKDIFNCLCKGKGQTETKYYQTCHFQKDCTCDTLILQSTLHIMISSVPMLFFCNSTTISEKNPHMARLYNTVPCQNQGFYKQVSMTLLPKPNN